MKKYRLDMIMKQDNSTVYESHTTNDLKNFKKYWDLQDTNPFYCYDLTYKVYDNESNKELVLDSDEPGQYITMSEYMRMYQVIR